MLEILMVWDKVITCFYLSLHGLSSYVIKRAQIQKFSKLSKRDAYLQKLFPTSPSLQGIYVYLQEDSQSQLEQSKVLMYPLIWPVVILSNIT